MAGLVVPQVPSGLSNEELAELVAKALKEIDWAFNGNISDQNISRIANFVASKTEFKHISGIVGMSGFDPGNPLAVRFWSGNADKDLGVWRVNQGGQMFAMDAFITGLITASIIIGSEIKTAEDGVYPRAEMSSIGKLFAAYQSADNFVTLTPDAFGSTPGFTFQNTASVVALMYLLNAAGVQSLFIGTPSGSADIDISSGKDLKLTGTNVSANGIWTFNKTINGSITGNAASADFATHAGTASAADELSPSGEIAWGQVLKGGSNLADLEVRNLSALTQNSSFRTSSDSEKATWNAKADAAQGPWIAPTLSNGWVNYSGLPAVVGYKKNTVSDVKIKGVIKNGTITSGTLLFTLPAGYRPLEQQMFTTTCFSAGVYYTASVDVNPNGNVTIENVPANGFLSLCGISFPAEQ